MSVWNLRAWSTDYSEIEYRVNHKVTFRLAHVNIETYILHTETQVQRPRSNRREKQMDKHTERNTERSKQR